MHPSVQMSGQGTSYWLALSPESSVKIRQNFVEQVEVLHQDAKAP